jgi:uncharacterized SAM-binding protein YcdF (DUF218 family)
MFIIKKVVTPFLLPPGLFVLVILALGIWVAIKRRKRQALALYILAAFIWIPSIGPTADAILRRLETGLSVPASVSPDVIIMLGGDLLHKSQDLSGTGAPGYGTMERMVTAVRLHRRTGAPILLSGGRVFADSGSIAGVTARFLADLGVSGDAILIEDRSRDTYENALFSAKICRREGFTHPVVVTTGFHMKRALFCFQKMGLAVQPFPCGLTSWPEKTIHWRSLLPGSQALGATAAGLHEALGLFYYRLRY